MRARPGFDTAFVRESIGMGRFYRILAAMLYEGKLYEWLRDIDPIVDWTAHQVCTTAGLDLGGDYERVRHILWDEINELPKRVRAKPTAFAGSYMSSTCRNPLSEGPSTERATSAGPRWTGRFWPALDGGVTI